MLNDSNEGSDSQTNSIDFEASFEANFGGSFDSIDFGSRSELVEETIDILYSQPATPTREPNYCTDIPQPLSTPSTPSTPPISRLSKRTATSYTDSQSSSIAGPSMSLTLSESVSQASSDSRKRRATGQRIRQTGAIVVKLLDLIKEYVYLREGNGFKVQALNSIVLALRLLAVGEVQRALLDTDRVSSKIINLYRDQKIQNFCLEQSGQTRDPVSSCLSVPELVLDAFFVKHKDYKKFRTKLLEYEAELDTLFRGIATTGTSAISIDAAVSKDTLEDLSLSTISSAGSTDSFDLRRAAVINSTRVAKNAARQTTRTVVEGSIEGLISILREGTEALCLLLLPERQLAELLRTKLFERIDRRDKREAAKELRQKGVAEVNYFLSKDIEDQVERIESIIAQQYTSSSISQGKIATSVLLYIKLLCLSISLPSSLPTTIVSKISTIAPSDSTIHCPIGLFLIYTVALSIPKLFRICQTTAIPQRQPTRVAPLALCSSLILLVVKICQCSLSFITNTQCY